MLPWSDGVQRLLLTLLVASLVACESAEEVGPAIANGACAFTGDDPALAPGVEGAGYAVMNGSFNARVLCGQFGAGAVDSLELAIGNGNYDGVGEYWFDASTASGFLTLIVGETEYSSRFAATGDSCRIVVSEGIPPAESGEGPPSGSTIAGTFECAGLGVLGEDGSTIDLADGEFRVVLR